MATLHQKREMRMPSKRKGNESTSPHATPTQAAETPESSARDEDIRRRAYKIYLARGEQPSRDLDDWLAAERELEGTPLSRAQAG
jgi:BRCT domain type II-containing protein